MFNDLKKGDFVLFEKEISFGFHKSVIFKVKEEVKKITKTKIILKNGKEFRKENGTPFEKGTYHKIFNFDESLEQSLEMSVFQDRVNRFKKMKELISTLDKNINKFNIFTDLGVVDQFNHSATKLLAELSADKNT